MSREAAQAPPGQSLTKAEIIQEIKFYLTCCVTKGVQRMWLQVKLCG